MKIGILTFHYGYNYGGLLQAYATQQTLKNMGYNDVFVINCIADKLKFAMVGIPRRVTGDFLPILWRRCRYGGRIKKPFHEFRKKYLNETSEIGMESLPEAVKDFDAIIVGSDQVWNKNGQQNGLYFFNWSQPYQGKKISYAPCCGRNEVFEPMRKQTADALKSFDSLSVRNMGTQAFVKGLTGIEAPIVPDPTCLHDFHELFVEKPVVLEPYIFVYQLGAEINGGNAAAMAMLRKKYPGRKIIAAVIAYANPQVNASWADEIRYDLSPKDWINMIRYADLVYTDSFHGTIFSMRANVPFITYLREKSRMARFVDLKQQFDIGNNIVSSLEEIQNFNPGTRNFDAIFEEMKNVGVGFLKEALKK